MVQIKVRHLHANEVMDIVHDLRKLGLVQGTDFDFAYAHAKYNNDGWEAVEPRTTVFTFYTKKWATWFTLKYSSNL